MPLRGALPCGRRALAAQPPTPPTQFPKRVAAQRRPPVRDSPLLEALPRGLRPTDLALALLRELALLPELALHLAALLAVPLVAAL
eukprot:3879874-Alexandrium_andersonii.AAC.1